jgi:hypothetical protein
LLSNVEAAAAAKRKPRLILELENKSQENGD